MQNNFEFRNLTAEVRQHMLAEIDRDIADDVLVLSKRFNENGEANYPALLRSAATEHDEAWLAEQILSLFNATELSGGKVKTVPRNSHTLFAQGEFNRFYCRAICLFVLEHPVYNIRIYRARQSQKPRPESEAKIGKTLEAAIVLKDLRDHLATEVEFGPNETNSGLSLELMCNANSL